MTDDRGTLDDLIRLARKNARRWESMTEPEQREFQVSAWEAIAGSLNDTYLEQRAGHHNYRLTQEDVFYARRLAVWMRFDLERKAWLEVPENAAAFDLAKRVAGQTGPAAILSDEVKRRLESRPKAPDTWDPPYLAPDGNKPADWPEMTGSWSVWIEDLIRMRRPSRPALTVVREPGEDTEEDPS